MRHVLERARDGLFREGGLTFRDRDGGDDQAAVTDGRPVVAAAHPGFFVGDEQAGLQRFFDEGGGELCALLGDERIVQPVEAGRQPEGALRRVEEVLRIPVRQFGHRAHFQFSAGEKSRVSREPIRQRQRQNAALGLAHRAVPEGTGVHVGDRWLVEETLGRVLHDGEDLLRDRVVRDLLPQGGRARGVSEEPWVRGDFGPVDLGAFHQAWDEQDQCESEE